MHFLYNLGIRFYSIFIFIASFFNPKAKEWIDGRTDFFNKLPELKSDNIKECYIEIANNLPQEDYFNKLKGAMLIWANLF